ncbi:hypothetical protein [Halobacteriovorax sp. HLS]|uniref:hypothetical protein n=1 Tax=Halobacteriovorax sp. HLS TaxID=2234000 RepID=UPI000FD8F82B|nr:hypothetical protein [Halobacteriovorax sp. HLS]
MKKINIVTTFKANFSDVKENFNEKLFKFLSPKLIPNEIIRYDGNNVGDEIHIQLINQLWISEILEVNDLENEFNFVDIGKKLPPPIKSWHHKHRIVKVNQYQVSIIDEISFDCGNFILNNCIYPFMYAQFYARVPLYKKFFEKKLYE